MLRVTPLSVETHERGVRVAERHGLSICDGTIIASALLGECGILYTEDLQNGQLIDAQVLVRNPFALQPARHSTRRG